jgi:hypothetical protein
MSKPKSNKCHMCDKNITPKMNPGVRCVKCQHVEVHRSCAKMKAGHEIWRCESCEVGISKNPSSSSQKQPKRRSSLIPIPISQVATATSSKMSIEILEKEIVELKQMNIRMLNMLSQISGRLMDVDILRNENMRLKAKLRATKLIDVNYSAVGENSHQTAIERTEGSAMVAESQQTEVQPNDNNACSGIINNRECSVNDKAKRDQLMNSRPLKFIHISKLRPETNCDDVKSFVSTQLNIESMEIHCRSLIPKALSNPHYSSFKVGVPLELFEKALNLTNWPRHSTVREFVDHERSNFQLGMLPSVTR